jgi:hypothetical protein
VKGARPKPEDLVVTGWLPRRAAWVVAPLAGAFLLAMVAATAGWNGLMKARPGPARYFTQLACLFPDASELAIEYRAEAWSCARRRWEEIDPRPHFPLHASDKESRFQRVGFFYRSNDKVMRALEDYVRGRHNGAGAPADGLDGPIGGLRLLSLRTPFPPPGGDLQRWHWKPLADFPDEQRKYWYWTPPRRREAQCVP